MQSSPRTCTFGCVLNGVVKISWSSSVRCCRVDRESARVESSPHPTAGGTDGVAVLLNSATSKGRRRALLESRGTHRIVDSGHTVRHGGRTVPNSASAK